MQPDESWLRRAERVEIGRRSRLGAALRIETDDPEAAGDIGVHGVVRTVGGLCLAHGRSKPADR
jgi:hypothetical protein